MNSAVAAAAEARVDEVLPVQEQMHELLGFPDDAALRIEVRQAMRAKGGRPRGARNKRLAEVAQLVRAQFGDVLLQQVAIATMPLEDLIALGLHPSDALVEKRLSAATVLPYIEQKKPIAVDVTGRSVVFLDIQIGTGEGQQDQGVVDGLVLQLDSAQLDGAAKPLASQAVLPGGQLIEDQSASGAARDAAGQVRGRTPGGAVFAPRRPPHAPATVVSPEVEVFEPTGKQGSAEPGVGE